MLRPWPKTTVPATRNNHFSTFWQALSLRGKRWRQESKGAFSHSAGTAPIIALFIPETPPENHPPTEARAIHSKPHRGCRRQHPGTRGYRRWKTADFSHSAGTAHGAPPNLGKGGTRAREAAMRESAPRRQTSTAPRLIAPALGS